MRPGAADLEPPVGYDDRWLFVAALAVVAVAAYYLVVWVATRPRRVRRPRATTSVRERCLAELDEVERSVADGTLSSRDAHQRVSRAVRAFVEESGSVPAGRMTLSELRTDGPAPVAELVAVLYPGEFGPGDGEAGAVATVPDTLLRARALVEGWR